VLTHSLTRFSNPLTIAVIVLARSYLPSHSELSEGWQAKKLRDPDSFNGVQFLICAHPEMLLIQMMGNCKGILHTTIHSPLFFEFTYKTTFVLASHLDS
jgi:hypothetical protein